MLCVFLMSSVIGVALAETDDEKGIRAIWTMLEENFDEDGAGGFIEKDTFTVTQNLDGEIVIVVDASVLLAVFGARSAYGAEIISRIWLMFASASREYTERDVFMFLNYQGNVLYFISPSGILDVKNEVVYDHIRHK